MTLGEQNNRNFVRLKKIIYIAMNSLVVSQVLLIMIKIRKGHKSYVLFTALNNIFFPFW